MLVDVGKAPVLAFVQRNGADLQLEGHEFWHHRMVCRRREIKQDSEVAVCYKKKHVISILFVPFHVLHACLEDRNCFP